MSPNNQSAPFVQRSARRPASRQSRGFTLIEVAATLFVSVLLLSLARQNLLAYQARTNAQSCATNLMRIEAAKRQWALDKRKPDGATVNLTDDLVGPDKYLIATPICPSNGVYDVINVATAPTCNIGTNNTGATNDDHVLSAQ